MPFFSFSFKTSINKEQYSDLDVDIKNIISSLDNQTMYYSKNTRLWKFLNKKKIQSSLEFLNFEKRNKVDNVGKSILFCLPPSLGLGDIIEYGLAIKALNDSDIFSNVGICFTGKYKNLLKKYFLFNNIFSDVIDEINYNSFETIFHVTLEINSFKNQKFIRSDIEENLINYFNVDKFRFISNNSDYKVSKITIFPNSKSPLRTMTIKILDSIVLAFKKNYFIEIVLDNSDSNFLNLNNKNLIYKNVNIITPSNTDELLNIVELIQFGIFMDSGPLHVAKILNKKGILIENSVSSKILLNKFDSIKVFKNYYSSAYCNAPCGLTNIINYNDNYGCFDSMKINKSIFNDSLNLNSLQRGRLKKHYKYFIDNPVSCLKRINTLELNKFINRLLR